MEFKMKSLASYEHEQTGIFNVDKELWAWTSFRNKSPQHNSISDYFFDLFTLNKENEANISFIQVCGGLKS